ncbi:DUF86 domain-containing protein [Bradyrhizobium sp. WSM3983]|uniref:HepT-like ribonuclease domain-containing protein n=1 Tax=Bradyrhizobium sp. WSM3983 TaxID=1038867 RepID=UPI0003F88D3F|nr:HepT-like ribonuclease domain-containing protein [Bradyrhizobium sp. WSM3983]
MQRDPRAFLWDVQQAAEAITAFTAGLDVLDYRASPLIRSAVERQFEIIGEALNRLSKEAPDLADRVPNLRKIVSFRNLLIHGYAVVDDGRVWEIVTTMLPSLRATVTALLTDLGPPDV